MGDMKPWALWKDNPGYHGQGGLEKRESGGRMAKVGGHCRIQATCGDGSVAQGEGDGHEPRESGAAWECSGQHLAMHLRLMWLGTKKECW